MAQVMCTKRVLIGLKEGNVRTKPGRIYDAKDAVVKAAPHAFEPLEEWEHAQTLVEQATAAPGETRTVKKPASKKVAKSSDD